MLSRGTARTEWIAAPTRKLGYVVTASREGGSAAYGYGYGYGGYGYAEPENIEKQRATVDEADRV